jgi:penicillin-binding protein 2
MNKTRGYMILRGGVILAFCILGVRLWYMQIVRAGAYRTQATQHEEKTPIVLAPRGIIYDRNGIPLVRNLPNAEITVTPRDWPPSHSRREAIRLSTLLHADPSPDQILKLIRANRTTLTPVLIKNDMGMKTFDTVQTFANRLPGVDTRVELTRREYLDPGGHPLAHILGYTGAMTSTEECTYMPWISSGCPRGARGYPPRRQRYTMLDEIGQAGIEAEYQNALHGENGLSAYTINVQGNQVGPSHVIKRPIPGDGVELTIDEWLEKDAARDLLAGMRKLGTKQGAAVAVNPSNGQILAMVSFPSFDENDFTLENGTKRDRAISRLEVNPNHPLFDLATQGEYPPGSIFKIVTATAGLEDGVITPTTEADDTGALERCPGCQVYHGWDPSGLGWVNVVTAIEKSSDIFFYQVAGGGPDIPGHGLGPRRLGAWARGYGLGKAPDLGLPGVSAGIVPSRSYLWKHTVPHRPWSWGDSYNMGIGQGFDLVTPLQMARVVSTIANGGNLVRLRIVKAITTPNGHKPLAGQNFAKQPVIVRRHLVAPWAVSLIRQGMRLGASSSEGTSYYALDPRLDAAGKTGTAQTTVNTHDEVDGWWVGFAPYEHPQIAVSVVIPDSDSEGATSAAPIAGKIIADYLHLKNPKLPGGGGWKSGVYHYFAGLQ